MNDREKLDILRRGGLVRRYHTARSLRTQTVGEHCYHMGVLYDYICRVAGTVPDEALHRAIRYHDTPEAVYGDIPSPAKKEMSTDALEQREQELLKKLGVSTELRESSTWLLKALDNLEGAMTCAEEWTQGNHYMREIGLRYVDYLKELCAPDRCPAMLGTHAVVLRLIYIVEENLK